MGANAQTSVPAFTAGQILTAQQQTEINTGIPVFANTTARDAAFGSTGEKVLAEGQFAYIEATDSFQYYTGSAFVEIYPLPTWTTWTPTWSGLTVGNGTVIARYVQFNKTIIAKTYLSFGSTTSITGPLDMTLPVTPTNNNGIPFLGWASYQDGSSTIYFGATGWIGGSTVRFIRYVNTANQITNAELSNVAPFTWGTGDTINTTIIYEA